MNELYPHKQANHRQIISSETLAYWFLRLNGFLTTVNFVVHPDEGREQRTDIDILGSRFPHRSELFENPMVDHEIFTNIKDKVYIVIAEVKRGRCRLNGPWTNPERGNMQRVLRAIGAFSEDRIEEIAIYLYKYGFYENSSTLISLLCIGNQVNKEILTEYPEVPQISWNEILSFIHLRFQSYRQQKSAHVQWDDCGKLLWDLALKNRKIEEFINKIDIV